MAEVEKSSFLVNRDKKNADMKDMGKGILQTNVFIVLTVDYNLLYNFIK